MSYVQTNVDPHFDADRDLLIQVLDSVSLLQLIVYIDQELGVPLELSTLTLDTFATVDSVLETLDASSLTSRAAPSCGVDGDLSLQVDALHP